MKLHDWETRLGEYLAQINVAELGAEPCAKFAAGAVLAQTGIDCHAKYEGKYSTAIGAAKALRTLGAGDLESTFHSHMEARHGPAFAQRGDIVFDGEAVGVCIGGTAIFVADGALTEIPRTDWITAWASETARA